MDWPSDVVWLVLDPKNYNSVTIIQLLWRVMHEFEQYVDPGARNNTASSTSSLFLSVPARSARELQTTTSTTHNTSVFMLWLEALFKFPLDLVLQRPLGVRCQMLPGVSGVRTALLTLEHVGTNLDALLVELELV